MCGKQAEMFKVLGVESRIKIIELLKERGPLGVSEMADELGLTPSAVSQHLKVLRHAGFVHSERKGYWIPYDIDATALDGCRQMLSNVCNCDCMRGGKKEDELAQLKKREQELTQHLDEVRARIQELGKKE